MIIRNIITFLFVILFISHSHILASQKKVYMSAPNPNIYNDASELWDIDMYKSIESKWYIFSDKASVKLFRTAAMEQTIYQSLFLEKFVVLKKRKHKIFIEKVNDNAIKGWAQIEEFIILPHAIKTKHSITHKAILVNRLGEIKGDVNTVYPLKSPLMKDSKINEQGIKILEFAHIYKYYPYQNATKEERFVLLGKNSFFFPSEKKGDHVSASSVILGWVPENRILEWNTREALQPNENRQFPIYYFKNKSDLEAYYSLEDHQGRVPNPDLLVIEPDTKNHIDRSQWPPEVMRYTIHNKIYKDKPVKIGISTASLQSARVGQYIERQSEQAKKKNIVFLIDATQSMAKYVPLTHQILKNITKKFRTQNTSFAFAVYRDYKDNEFRFQILQQLTKKLPETINKGYIRGNDEVRNDPSAFPEAVFQGIIRCIKEINWEPNSTRLLIHIGDAGNDSRGEDAYIEQDIAKLLVEKNISYSVIQILGRSSEDDKIFAEKLLCKQVYNTFKFTSQLWIDKLTNVFSDNVKNNTYKNYIRNLKRIVSDTSNNSCCEQSVCCSCGQGRLLLTCLPSGSDNTYSQRIEDAIQRLSEQLRETQSMLEDLRLGNLPDMGTKQKASYRPQLLQSIIDNLIVSLGASQIATMPQNSEERQAAIRKKGKEILNKYLAENARFYTNAYVMSTIPGTNSSDQFKKMVLLQKNELENLIYPLDIFVNKFMKQIDKNNIKQIWISMMQAIIGQGSTWPLSMEYYSMSLKELYKQQHGISMRNDHKLLQIPYKDIESGYMSDIDQSDIDQLAKDLYNSYKQMKNIYDDQNSFFSVFNKQYIWIEASKLL